MNAPMKKAVLTVGSIVFLAIPSANSAERDAPLDPSCAIVNRAYANTRATELYGGLMFEAKADGSYVPIREYRFRKNAVFRRWVPGEWREERRVNPPLSYSSGPRFSDCRQIDSPTPQSKSGRYAAKWYGAPYTGKVEVWLMPDELKLERVLVTYDEHFRPAPYVSQLELFSYDPDNTEFPKP